MSWRTCVAVAWTIAAGWAGSPSLARAADDAMLGHLPAGALVVGEAAHLGVAFSRLEQSDLVRLLTETPQWKAYLASPDYQRLLAGRRLVEAQLGMDAVDAAKRIFGHRVVIAVYPKPGAKQQDVAFVVQVADVPLLDKARRTLDWFIQLAGPSIVDGSARIDGVTVWTVRKQFFFASKDGWFAGGTTQPLAEQTVKALLRKPLKAAASRKQASDSADDLPLLSFRVDVRRAIALAGKPSEPARFDNVVGAWLFGGVAELLRTTDHLDLGLRLGKQGLEASVEIPVRWGALPPAAKGYFNGPSAKSSPSIAFPNSMVCLTLDRDFVHLYKSREANLQPQILPEFDKFETGLSNLMPGRNFAEDILPLLGKRLTLVAGKQGFAHLNGEPAVKLPGFAFVLEPGDSEQAADLMQLIFQSVVAVLNFQVGERGGEPMVIRGESHRGIAISYGRHMRSNSKGPLPISFNFTPAAARVGPRLILSSSLDFCRQLVDGLQDQAPPQTQSCNASFVAAAEALAGGWSDNRTFFESKILQSGKSAAQAKRDFELVLRVLKTLDRLRAEGVVKPASYRLTVRLDWK